MHLEAPEYDPDIDGNNIDDYQNLIAMMSPTSRTREYKQNIPNLSDVNSPEPDAVQSRDNIPKTDWPDAPTVQIPRVSSTTTDVLSEVEYRKRTTTYTTQEEDIPKLEEDKDQ